MASWTLLAAFVLALFANGRWVLPLAAWAAFPCLLVYIASRPLKQSLPLAFLTQWLAFNIAWRGMIPVPGACYFLVTTLYVLVYFIPVALYAVVAARSNAFRTTLILPMAWVAIEFLFQSFGTPYGSWASLPYTQVDHLALAQLASATGMAGISFLILWGASAVSWAWANRATTGRTLPALATFGAVVVAVLLWGEARLLRNPPEVSGIRAAAITASPRFAAEMDVAMRPLLRGSRDADAVGRMLEAAGANNDDLIARIRREARAGAKLIVWSELAARVVPETEPVLVQRAQEIAEENETTIVMGVGRWDRDATPPLQNKAITILPGGAVRGYQKARPIVGQESFLAGGADSPAAIEAPFGRLTTVICHDLDFPGLIRRAGEDRTDILVAPSADWNTIAVMHARMARMRAIENGCSLLRPCSDGYSLATDPMGRTLALQRDGDADGSEFAVAVPTARVAALYPRTGDAFALVNVAGLLSWSLVWLVRRGRSGARRS